MSGIKRKGKGGRWRDRGRKKERGGERELKRRWETDSKREYNYEQRVSDRGKDCQPIGRAGKLSAL